MTSDSADWHSDILHPVSLHGACRKAVSFATSAGSEFD